MTLSSHVLDGTSGGPAEGVTVRWDRLDGESWEPVARAATDADGRVREWSGATPAAGTHRLVFDTGAYFAARRMPTFYPEVVVVFEVTEADDHHHVPLLLSPFAYSTYRGS
jgi:5-hydroxyisourate hydrolase